LIKKKRPDTINDCLVYVMVYEFMVNKGLILGTDSKKMVLFVELSYLYMYT